MTDTNTDSQSLKTIIFADITIATNNLLSVSSQLNIILGKVNTSSLPIASTLTTSISNLIYSISLLVNKITDDINPLLEKSIEYIIGLINNIQNIILGFNSMFDSTIISFTDLTGHIVAIIGGINNMITGIISMIFGIINLISVPPIRSRSSIINVFSGLVQNIMGLTIIAGTTNNLINYIIYSTGSISDDTKNDVNIIIGGIMSTVENITQIVNNNILIIKAMIPHSAHTITGTIGILTSAASALLSLVSNLNTIYNRIDDNMTKNFAVLLSSTSTMVGTISSILNSINDINITNAISA